MPCVLLSVVDWVLIRGLEWGKTTDLLVNVTWDVDVLRMGSVVAVEVDGGGAGEKLEARDMPRRLLRCGLYGADVVAVEEGARVEAEADADAEAGARVVVAAVAALSVEEEG